MAKKRTHSRRSRTADSRTADSRTADSRTADSRTADSRTADDEPAFWFGFEVTWAKLVIGRVLLFGLLAIDALLQIRHAPRYGAGAFNVAQLPGLDWLGPSRPLYEIAELVNAYLFVLAACGVATRIAIPIATGIYAWLYFGSQLDSYQHHYLVSLILLLACFIPWPRPVDARPSLAVRAWALRLVLIQLGILYLWAAISKMNSAWFDGRTLAGQISGPLRDLIEWRLPGLGWSLGLAKASKLVVVIELVLATTVWVPRAWRIAAPLGLLLHLGILLSGLEIGLFAWLMIVLYVFIVPDTVWQWLAETPPVRALRAVARQLRGRCDGPTRWPIWIAANAIAIGLAALCRFEHALGVALAITIVVVLLQVAFADRGPRLVWLGIVHLIAIATWLSIDRASTVAFDYYRFWGGTSRRLGDTTTAEHAYRELIDVVPDEPTGHYQLGRLLLSRDASEQGLTELHTAERLEPGRARAFLVEARWLASHHRNDDALAKARDAARADPADKDARDLAAGLAGSGTAPPPPREDDRP